MESCKVVDIEVGNYLVLINNVDVDRENLFCENLGVFLLVWNLGGRC